MKAHFYSPMGLRGENFVTLFNRYNARVAAIDISGISRHGISSVLRRLFAWMPGIRTSASARIFLMLPMMLAWGLSDSLGSTSPEEEKDLPPPLFQTSFSEPPGENYWMGDLAFFRTVPGNVPGLLRQHAPPDLGSVRLSTRESYPAIYWEWYVKQGFAPSNNNRAFMYLNADSGSLDEQTTGWVVRTGENGTPKHFRLFRYEQGGTRTEILKSDITVEGETGYRIRVLITPDRKIHLYVGRGRSSTPLLQTESALLPEDQALPDGHFGIRTRYTATRSDQFYFSDVWIADAFPGPGITDIDTPGPSDQAFMDNGPWQPDSNGTIIRLTFNVPPEPSHLTTSTFQLGDGTGPDAIHCPHPQTCLLLFEGGLVSGEYLLLTESYETIYGQVSDPGKHSFLIAGEARAGDVILNEFMYRPPSGTPSYVELLNTSTNIINLRNWRLQRRAVSTEPLRLISAGDVFLHPGEYLVLAADDGLKDGMPDARNIHVMEAFPRFNIASSDEIRLFSGSGALIDSLQYHPSSWGGSGVALERRSPSVPSWIPQNWEESRSPAGGTPGYTNTAAPPDSPPELVHIEYTNPQRIVLSFSRWLDAGSVSDAGAIHLETTDHDGSPDAGSGFSFSSLQDHGISYTAVMADEKTVLVLPDVPLQHGRNYRIRVTGIRDLFGTPMRPAEQRFTYYDVVEATPHDVILNELLYRPDQGRRRRFVEILNRSDKVFDLRGWKIGRRLGSPVDLFERTCPEPVYLVPGEKMVISEPGLIPADDGVHLVELTAFPSLSRFGDQIYLLSAGGITADSLSYFPEWGGNRDGVSLERVDPDGASGDPANWSEHPESHSAGQRNHHFNDTPLPVALDFAVKVDDRDILLHFSRFVSVESFNSVALDGRPLSLLPLDTTLNLEMPSYGSVFRFRSSNPIERRHARTTISSVRDFAGRAGRNLEAPLVFVPEPGDVIINEVMYQPVSDRYGNRPDQSEYVEVLNRSDLHLSMEQLFLHDQPDKNNDVQKLMPEETALLSLAPGEYFVFHADTSVDFHNTRIYQAFAQANPEADRFVRIDRLTLGLSTQGDRLYISTGNRRILDSLWFDPGWHNPNLPDVRGISLERIDRHFSTQDRTNWTSSASPQGGTPGTSNSVTVRALKVSEHGLSLGPNPFSPNGNGMDDHLVIQYQLDDPDYLMHVRIFDRQGRIVRTLADGDHAGRSGTLIWDGRTDRGLMNRTGLYIIHFEAYNYSANRKKTFREIAVLAVPL
ncbi:MAG: lamin tail domain-containing protein [Cyclonatronaceae bacterium]